ncbi:TonB family protein [Kingella kingae]|uniref:energy transducer TonB n=1 Tax=Kingella kingae TaxID=504 RepID=UPI00057099FA|nr:energy transducer TonB [Kingella kingae]MDK4543825.1 TonB family protein [Kingella kingae]MDK4565994.1 TonB family protein [Kingella kingae]MDK4590961.1 TonB family protein [Kingella kingae]MDK4627893.1 TonB family protein [Kingella kingae]MDK4635618.1 TonB family protein [Kingella kingae]
MKNNRLLNPSVVLVVSLLHAGIIALAWETRKPPEPVSVDNLTFVDLGSLDGNDQPAADGAPAPLESKPAEPEPVSKPTPPPVAPTPPKPEPVAKAEPTVKAVVRNDKPADVVEAKPKLEPIKPVVTPPKPEIPIKQPAPPTPTEPVNKPTTPTTETPLKPSNTAGGAPANAVHRQEGGTGGGGSNPNSQAPKNNAGGSATGSGTGARGSGQGSSGGGAGGIVDGGYTRLPSVSYPPASLDADEEGSIKLAVTVEPNGTVSDVTVIKSTGHARLDNAAKRAARSAGYRAKEVDGVKVRTRFTTSYEFKLD